MAKRMRPFIGVAAVLVLLLTVAVPTHAAPDGPYKLSETEVAQHAAKIDELVEAGLVRGDVRPNRPAKDDVFLRRIYLDAIGRVPSYDEAKEFLDSRRRDRRQRLIDELLVAEGRVSHEFNYWADVLRILSRMDGGIGGGPYIEWVKNAFRQNMPYDQFVRELLTSEGRITENGAVGYYLRDAGMLLCNTSSTFRVFLATNISCAQCHDHPFDMWTQMEFYETAAFTYGVALQDPGGKGRELARIADEIRRNDEDRTKRRIASAIDSIGRQLRRSVTSIDRPLRLPADYKYADGKPGDIVKARTILGPIASAAESDKPARVVFAEWMTSKENTIFAQVIANRYWKRAFGIGIIEPHDEIRADTKPANPELMDYLTQLMLDLDYDLREFQRVVFNTRTYQREATRDQPEEGKRYLFAGPLLRRMSAEQIWDSFITLAVPDVDATVKPEPMTLAYDIDEMSVQQIVEMVENQGGGMDMMSMMGGGADRNAMVRASELTSPAPPGHVLERFGQSDRQLIETASKAPSVTQVLNLMNGWIDNVLLKDESVLYKNVKRARTVKDKLDAIWISILGRYASPQDRSLAMAEIRANDDDIAFNNLVWAMLNSREFLFIQ